MFDIKLIRNKLYGVSNRELTKKVYNDVCDPFIVKTADEKKSEGDDFYECNAGGVESDDEDDE